MDDALKLENQLCFPLYVAAKEVVRQYTPLLAELDLTYTQYIAMMVLWEHGSISVKELGAFLHLDSGTLTPLLKRLESKGYLARSRYEHDERSVIVEITEGGQRLKEKALSVPASMSACMPFSQDEAQTLYDLLYKLIGSTSSCE